MVMRPRFGAARLSYFTACVNGDEEPLSPGLRSIIVAKMAPPSTAEADKKAQETKTHRYVTYKPPASKDKDKEEEKDGDDEEEGDD